MKLSDGLCSQAIVPVYGTPRTVAGDAITTDANKCQLKPLARSDYAVSFTDPQWGALQATFPSGVCDFSKPGVSRGPTVPWLTYQNARGRVIYGGRSLRSPPRSTRCTLAKLKISLPSGSYQGGRVFVNRRLIRVVQGQALRAPIVIWRYPSGKVKVRVVAQRTGGGQVAVQRKLVGC